MPTLIFLTFMVRFSAVMINGHTVFDKLRDLDWHR